MGWYLHCVLLFNCSRSLSVSSTFFITCLKYGRLGSSSTDLCPSRSKHRTPQKPTMNAPLFVAFGVISKFQMAGLFEVHLLFRVVFTSKRTFGNRSLLHVPSLRGWALKMPLVLAFYLSLFQQNHSTSDSTLSLLYLLDLDKFIGRSTVSKFSSFKRHQSYLPRT